jgi:hypothetical protein
MTLVRPAPIYGSESLPQTWKDENMLQIFERKILREYMAQVRKMV